MKIDLTDKQVSVICRALEAFTRMRLGQFRYALEEVLPDKTLKVHSQEIDDLEWELKKLLFPELPRNGGFGIFSPKAGEDAQIAYDLENVISQFVALKKSDGYFGMEKSFDGDFCKASDEPSAVIEGHQELLYKDFPLPEGYQEQALFLYQSKQWGDLWDLVKKNTDLPLYDKAEIIESFTEDPFCGQRILSVRCHKPRKPFDDTKF